MPKKKIYLCDIDGTLANNKHRGPFEEGKVIDDTPLPTVTILKSLIESKHRIIYFSGRTEKCRTDTTKWLREHVGGEIKLYMREKRDNRGDDTLKEELYNTYIKDKYQVIGVFDDRLRVCRMWYKLGIFVFNCNQGLEEF